MQYIVIFDGLRIVYLYRLMLKFLFLLFRDGIEQFSGSFRRMH
jgi:hypothetical protein